MRFARTPPGRNYNRWKRCPEQSCQVFGKWLSGPRNSAQLGSTSRSNNRNHIFVSSPGCLRLCSKILSSSLARSRSILCGRPPLTPLNSTLCMTKKKREEKKREERKEREKKCITFDRKRKRGKNNKTGRTHRLVYEAKNSFFFRLFYRTETRQKDSFSRSFRRNFFFFPAFPGLESSHRCVYLYACIAFFIRERVKKFHCPFWQFFFFFIRSIRISDFLKVMIMIIVNSPPRRSLLPSLDLILHLEKKGKSSEILTRSFKLRIFNFLSWEENGVERKFLSTVFIYDDNISR